MLYTSYFGKLKAMERAAVVTGEVFFPAAICRYPPKCYNSAVMKELSPTPSILWEYKNSMLPERKRQERYTKRFESEVLGRLSIEEVIGKLVNTLPFEAKAVLHEEGVPIWESKTVHIVLLCFEKAGDFCHRSLVADWLSRGIRERVSMRGCGEGASAKLSCRELTEEDLWLGTLKDDSAPER